MNTFFFFLLLPTLTTSNYCPYLSRETNEQPVSIRLRASQIDQHICFNISTLFAFSEQILTFSCTLYSGTRTTKGFKILSHKTSFTASTDDPLITCPVPANALPAVDLLSVALTTSWYATSFEHHIFSGIDGPLEELMFGADRPLKLNIGSGTQLLTAAKGWVNFDSMAAVSPVQLEDHNSRQDWASAEFQEALFEHARNSSNTNRTEQRVEAYHLVRWDLELGLHFIPTGYVDIININCVLYLYRRSEANIVAIIKEINRVLKPGGIVRIAERYEDDGVLRSTVLRVANRIFGKNMHRNVEPLTTYTGDLETLHLNHPTCVNCMRMLFKHERNLTNITPDLRVQNRFFTKHNHKFEQSMLQQGCWICHIDIKPTDEFKLRECNANYKNVDGDGLGGDGCEFLGSIWGQAKNFRPQWALEFVKSLQSGEDIFELRRRGGLLLNINRNWPCFKGEKLDECTRILNHVVKFHNLDKK